MVYRSTTASQWGLELPGLKADLDLYMHPETRAFVQISAVLDIIGCTDIKLSAVNFQS